MNVGNFGANWGDNLATKIEKYVITNVGKSEQTG